MVGLEVVVVAGAGFPKALRLRRRSEFLEVQKRGRRRHTPHFVLLLVPRPDAAVRLGVTVSKKVGHSVARNRVKRLIREVFRRRRDRFPAGHDLIVVAKAGAAELSYADVESELAPAVADRS